jgi:hypothetical protein
MSSEASPTIGKGCQEVVYDKCRCKLGRSSLSSEMSLGCLAGRVPIDAFAEHTNIFETSRAPTSMPLGYLWIKHCYVGSPVTAVCTPGRDDICACS